MILADFRLDILLDLFPAITLLDAPFLLAGEVWGLLIDNVSPGTESALVSWSSFLQGGGRAVLGIFAALASLAAENFFAKNKQQEIKQGDATG